MPVWIDTHCHLDAAEFAGDRSAMRARAAANGVAHCVLPAVRVGNFAAVRELAHRFGDSYALGIHPLCVPQAADADLAALDAELALYRADPRLVAVGEIGLDYFVPGLTVSPLRERQECFYREQLKLARRHGLPVILHVRRSADRLLKHLRELAPSGGLWHGIAHAFNGSEVQAAQFIALGFKLGFGGAVTFERALQLRRLAATLPLDAIVLETDAPDIPPHWLYKTAQQRETGHPQGRNEPAELPRIAQVVADLHGMPLADLAQATTRNAVAALPRLQELL
ncbi:MAG: TatD family deoxyribonuclease [Burkholderiaceae bacterium]|nr:MAG: TatD family deoxyribonuclease [Burkholderiaceae bacterium]TBR75078.1 MAG: TatD family deoxyribonuclease [Burkholderiaceae bacterium]